MELFLDLRYEPRLKDLKVLLGAHGSPRHREFETLLLYSQGRCLIVNLLLDISVDLNEFLFHVLRERLNDKTWGPTFQKFEHDVYCANSVHFVFTVYHESWLYQLFQQHDRLAKSDALEKRLAVSLF